MSALRAFVPGYICEMWHISGCLFPYRQNFGFNWSDRINPSHDIVTKQDTGVGQKDQHYLLQPQKIDPKCVIAMRLICGKLGKPNIIQDILLEH